MDNIEPVLKVLTYQFKFLLLFALQLFNVLGKVWPVKLMVEPLLNLEYFVGDATKGLSYLMDQLPVVVKIIMGTCPQVGLMSSGRQSTAKSPPGKIKVKEMYN